MQTVGPPLQVGDAPAGRVYELDRVISDHVIHVALHEDVGVQREVDARERRCMLLVVQIDSVEPVLESVEPRVRQRDGRMLRVDLEIPRGGERAHEPVRQPHVVGRPVIGAREDER